MHINKKGEGKSILVVNQDGELRTLYAPFRVVCIRPVLDLKLNQQVYVDLVGCTPDGKLFYVIFKHAYPHSYFSILIRF